MQPTSNFGINSFPVGTCPGRRRKCERSCFDRCGGGKALSLEPTGEKTQLETISKHITLLKLVRNIGQIFTYYHTSLLVDLIFRSPQVIANSMVSYFMHAEWCRLHFHVSHLTHNFIAKNS